MRSRRSWRGFRQSRSRSPPTGPTGAGSGSRPDFPLEDFPSARLVSARLRPNPSSARPHVLDDVQQGARHAQSQNPADDGRARSPPRRMYRQWHASPSQRPRVQPQRRRLPRASPRHRLPCGAWIAPAPGRRAMPSSSTAPTSSATARLCSTAPQVIGATSGAGPLDTTASFTVAAWVTVSAKAPFPSVVSQAGDTSVAFVLGVGRGQWTFSMSNGDTSVSGSAVRASRRLRSSTQRRGFTRPACSTRTAGTCASTSMANAQRRPRSTRRRAGTRPRDDRRQQG